MFVYSYDLIVVRNREDKNSLVELVLTRYQSIQLDDSICRNDDAMSVLPIRDVESLVIAFHLQR